MVGILKPRRSLRLKDVKKVHYDESSDAGSVPDLELKPKHVKRKIKSSDDEDGYEPDREATPVDGSTPNRRVKRKVCMSDDARQRAVDKSPNKGACILSRLNDRTVQFCHVLPRATDSSVLASLEWWWGLTKTVNVDSHHNVAFRASPFPEASRYAWAYLHTVRGDLHVLWDRGDLLIAPMPDVVMRLLDKFTVSGRYNIWEVLEEEKFYSYSALPHPALANSQTREGFACKFDLIECVQSQAKPHFMILNAVMKIKENKKLWIKVLEAFYKRINLKADASRVVEGMVTLADLWTAPPPWDAQLVRNEDEPQELEDEPQEVEGEQQEAEDEPSLPIIIPTGIPRTPERPKAVIGPGGLVQEIGRESKTPEPEDEPCYSNLKSCAAQLAPTGSRCLLSLQDDKSVQCCHVVARSTTHKTRQNLAAWWGLVDFDINTPFNIFLLRADVHSMWDQGDLLFMPEPEVIKKFFAQSIVPIDVGVSLDEPFEVCDGPTYKYCVVAHRDVPDTDKSCAFRREFKTVGYVYSRVPPQFATYNAGLALSKGAGPADFVMALDAFYKEHKVDYNAIDILDDTLQLFRRWVHSKPRTRRMRRTVRRK
ncbi:hypothetical protein POSPLADRAFT_1158788 [Postia placenta MAD-698-R-SB12]|uniref:HNH nuclease domain-containing protein n=1 Tax=Postia placenta MAD-698-R-SB12 TaxID=670580 RepID=A0A1X6MKU0_9APHY|nr:hypothetical protein POSPLADRAFT_1158788 [Postia placenta MAD-698-R-SB12]OSX56802.1 hypothetical protein POSPLADRAFT_1158788 [Postia placenta MAD-698-R-SB12]